MPDATTAAEKILRLTGLQRVTLYGQLVLVVQRFRPTQQQQLVAILEDFDATSSSESVLAHIEAYFDRKLDVKDEFERYLEDLLKIHHYIAHLHVCEDVAKQMMLLCGSLGNGYDRQILAKAFQTLGRKHVSAFCQLCSRLTLKYQQELLAVFADNLPELRLWMSWLVQLGNERNVVALGANSELSTPSVVIMEFLVKTVYEHCTRLWLDLLGQLASSVRLLLIEKLNELPITVIKQLGRFYQIAAIPVERLLELHAAVRQELMFLLNEFPTVTLLALFSKFNKAALIRNVKHFHTMLSKADLVKLIDILAMIDVATIEVFLGNMAQYARAEEFVRLFLNLATENQLRLLNLLVTTTARTPIASFDGQNVDVNENDHTSEHEGTMLFELFLNAHFHSCDGVIQKLSMLSNDVSRRMIKSISAHMPEELALIGEGIELTSVACLPYFLRLIRVVSVETRQKLVQYGRIAPTDESLPIYKVLDRITHEDHDVTRTHDDDLIGAILDMIMGLKEKDRRILCGDVLRCSSNDSDGDIINQDNMKLLHYLCQCTLPRHKVIRLLQMIPFSEHNRLLLLLQTQRIPEQVALMRLMLSLTTDAIGRLLDKISKLSTEVLDNFFELLLLIPKVELKALAKLLVSSHVTDEQLHSFIAVAANMMNQASSRELVLFTADLPVPIRNLFFEMLSDCPEKSVLLRIVACSTKVSSQLLHLLIEILHCMTWEVRSAFVEQIRALENYQDIEKLAFIAHSLEHKDSKSFITLLNPLQLSVRISFVSILLQLEPHERQTTLQKLEGMAKHKVSGYCTAICDPSCGPVASEFLKIFGLLNAAYQDPLLLVLQNQTCWFFVRIMADCVMNHPDDSSTLNGFAACLVLFQHEAEYQVLVNVVEEALSSSIELKELVVVLGNFCDASTSLEFLKYVRHFTKYAKSTTLFHVLSKYKETVFLYEMFRILDLDDAMFALKRLDRIWHRHQVELDLAMHALSQKYLSGDPQSKDEFCNLIFGFRECEAKTGRIKQAGPQTIFPRLSPVEAQEQGVINNYDDEPDWISSDTVLPTNTLPSNRSLQLERHMRRIYPTSEFPCKGYASRKWPHEIETPYCGLSGSEVGSSLSSTDESNLMAFVKNSLEFPVEFPSTIEGTDTKEYTPLEKRDESCTSSEYKCAFVKREFEPHEDNAIATSEQKPEGVTLPFIVSQRRPLQDQIGKHITDVEHRPLSSKNSMDTSIGGLSRTESAPATLGSYSIPETMKPKQYRGLTTALEVPSDFHISRHRGASIYEKEIERINANGPSRIRYSRTHEAQARIVSTRIHMALGHCQQTKVCLMPSLLRPDRDTCNRANAILATSTHFRSMKTDGLVSKMPLHSRDERQTEPC